FVSGASGFVELCGRSPEHVARVCRQKLDLTPVEIVNRARINYARQQLTATGRSILDIAFDCGFSSVSHFYSVFKSVTGLTPRQLRLEGRSTVPSALERRS
ncbi:MAG: helix-turn-helix transcriptional regulator, partial [Planctomycetes bacterium]|nr:helix-turn-helix transcriptional regulator [Planctomycetota bacterium]